MESSNDSRPVKRRKVGQRRSCLDVASKLPTPTRSENKAQEQSDLSDNSVEDDEPELPPIPRSGSGQSESPDIIPEKQRKAHVPKRTADPETTFVTQLTQPPSSPSRIRGPRWKKRVEEDETSEPELNPPGFQTLPRTRSPPGMSRQLGSAIGVASIVDDFDAMLEQNPDFFEDEFNATLVGAAAADTPNSRAFEAPKSFRQTTLFGQSTATSPPQPIQRRPHNWPLANKSEPPTHHKLDREAMSTWLYPTNLGTIRDYQFNITQRGLFHNLLVALPTGLGKTFIAATIMLNWYRWTKDAQIVFVAPTKPLVAQQVDACFNIVGIPRSDTSMLTGNVQPALRAEEWLKRRVFFMTPQTVLHDLTTGICDPKKIVLLVIDEAHRATGNYAYVEVVRFLRRFNSSFRVLALTATPGASVESVQNVIDSLDISRVEIRTEESLDIRQYVHRRNIELEIFDYSDEVTMSMDLFAKALQPIVNKLNIQSAYLGKDPMALTTYGLMKRRQQWMGSDAGKSAPQGLKGMVNTIFSLLASLAHAIDLLKYHGIGPFYRNLLAFRTETYENKKSGKYAKEIATDEHFKKLMNRLQAWINNPDFIGHPKLSFLKRIVLNHFLDAGDGRGAAGGRPPSDTRIMIFVHFRDSAEEVTRILKRHEPMIRPHVFVGQAGAKGSDGMDQKTQLDIIQKFKSGVYNTIVATSIGEEGLDIGEVDMIVCYDSSSSPIRMLQRMGRTGRKRSGNIYLLLMRGKEEDSYMKAKDNYEKMQEMIANGSRFNFHEDQSARIVPKDIQPVVDKRAIEIPAENTQGELPEPKKRRRVPKKPPKKFHMPDGVTNGFVKASRLNGNCTDDGDAPPSPKMDDQLVRLPALQDVLLSASQELQLEELYCNVSGTSPQFVRVPEMGSFPSLQHVRNRVHRVPHGRSSISLTQALTKQPPFANKMRPAQPPALPRTKIAAGEGLDEFSCDLYESEPIAIPSQDFADRGIDPSPLADLLQSKTGMQEPQYYISQEAKAIDRGSDDEDLPALSQLVGRGSAGDKENRIEEVMSKARPRERRRRVILDEEDDEDF